MAVGQIALGAARPQTAEMRLKHSQIIKWWMEGKTDGLRSSTLIFFSACAGSEGHHLWAAENRLRCGVWAQQQRQHRETKVHVHPWLQEARLHCEFGMCFKGSHKFTCSLMTFSGYYYTHTHTRTQLKTEIRKENSSQSGHMGQLLIGYDCLSLQNLQIKVCVYRSWHARRNWFCTVVEKVLTSFICIA